MFVVTAVDKNFGLRFNKRRVSRDSVVNTFIDGLSISLDKQLFVTNENTQRLFASASIGELFSEDGIWFIESSDELDKIKEYIDVLYIVNWEREYPSDEKLLIDLDDFLLLSKTKLDGSSHKSLTLSIYIRSEHNEETSEERI